MALWNTPSHTDRASSRCECIRSRNYRRISTHGLGLSGGACSVQAMHITAAGDAYQRNCARDYGRLAALPPPRAVNRHMRSTGGPHRARGRVIGRVSPEEREPGAGSAVRPRSRFRNAYSVDVPPGNQPARNRANEYSPLGIQPWGHRAGDLPIAGRRA
jgi:hypothetical protein